MSSMLLLWPKSLSLIGICHPNRAGKHQLYSYQEAPLNLFATVTCRSPTPLTLKGGKKKERGWKVPCYLSFSPWSPPPFTYFPAGKEIIKLEKHLIKKKLKATSQRDKTIQFIPRLLLKCQLL